MHTSLSYLHCEICFKKPKPYHGPAVCYSYYAVTCDGRRGRHVRAARALHQVKHATSAATAASNAAERSKVSIKKTYNVV